MLVAKRKPISTSCQSNRFVLVNQDSPNSVNCFTSGASARIDPDNVVGLRRKLLSLCLQTLSSSATRAAPGLSGIFCSSLDRITILGQSMCEQLLNDRIHFFTIDHLDHTVLGPKNSETPL